MQYQKTGKDEKSKCQHCVHYVRATQTSILCLPDEAALSKLIWSSFWTVEDQFVRSRYFSSRFAAQSAEVYIGAQSLHTSSDDFVLVGEFDFGVG